MWVDGRTDGHLKGEWLIGRKTNGQEVEWMGGKAGSVGCLTEWRDRSE